MPTPLTIEERLEILEKQVATLRLELTEISPLLTKTLEHSSKVLDAWKSAEKE